MARLQPALSCHCSCEADMRTILIGIIVVLLLAAVAPSL
jgi:hypothetical protein